MRFLSLISAFLFIVSCSAPEDKHNGAVDGAAAQVQLRYGLEADKYFIEPENLDRVEKIIREEVIRLLNDGLSENEIERAKKQIRGSIILSGESVGSHASSMGKGILLSGKVKTEEELLERITSVKKDDIIRVSEKIFGGDNLFKEIVKGK